MHPIAILLSVEFAKAAVRSAAPLIGAAVGETVAERSGFVNIGLEGMMLIGCFSGVAGSWWFHDAAAGVVFATLMGMASGLLLGWLSLFCGVNQIVAGASLNLIAAGMTTFLSRKMFGSIPPNVPGFEAWSPRWISGLPVIGRIFGLSPLVYALYLCAPIAGWIIFRTQWGLRLRAVGENPHAAESSGIGVRRYRMVALTCCGALAAVAGTYYSLGNVRVFTENMTSGNGYIALAVVIVARWKPLAVIPVSLLFGAAAALAYRAQTIHLPIPYEFLFMLPYILTLAVYGGLIGPGHRPGSLGRTSEGE